MGITKHANDEVVINRTFREFAEHYNIAVPPPTRTAARPGRGRSKLSGMRTLSQVRYVGRPYTVSLDMIRLTDGTVLRKDRDYKVGYRNNVNPGWAYVDIKGIGNCMGTMHYRFKIVR